MDSWRTKDRTDPNLLQDIMDGRVWKELKDHNGDPFFGNNIARDETRIGLTLNFDSFNFTIDQNSPSHSTGAISACITNLDTTERYQTKNLLLPFVIPPKDPNLSRFQEYVDILVDDLIGLYYDGFTLPSAPGRRIRAAVVVVICDHPAMCKFGGLAEKNHKNAPCTRCHVSREELYSEDSLRDGFRHRTCDEMKTNAAQYRDLPDEEKEEFFNENGQKWFAMSRLPYFDPSRMFVIDPMHNLLLGIVRTQWFDVWVKSQKTLRADTQGGVARELDKVHSLLKTAEFPPWLGRLPNQIGEPAGGSLHADEWKTLAIAFGPLALPIIFEDAKAASDQTYEREVESASHPVTKKYTALRKKWRKAVDKWNDIIDVRAYIKRHNARPGATPMAFSNDGMTTPPRPPTPEPPPIRRRIKDEDMPNFLKLSSALSILLARTITRDQLNVGYKFLTEYLLGFREIYGEENMKPNFHFAVHLKDQILDYGPVYGFWAFLQERLNYTLKNFNSNRRGRGEIEVTMMRSWDASVSLRQLLLYIVEDIGDRQDVVETSIRAVLARILADGAVARGTVEVMATSQPERDAQQTSFVLGARKPFKIMDPTLYTQILHHYNTSLAQDKRLYRDYSAAIPRGHTALSRHFDIATHLILDGRRITPSSQTRGPNIASSLIQIRDKRTGRWRAGELVAVFVPRQRELSPEPLAQISWLKESRTCPLERDVWVDCREALRIGTWEHGVYETTAAQRPPEIIFCSEIVSQVGRITVRKEKGSSDKLWMTIGLDQHGTAL